MYKSPYMTALKIAISLRSAKKNKARLTVKDFGILAENQHYTPSYFMKVKEVTEEIGIAIYPLNTGGYLLIDILGTTTNSILNIKDTFNQYLNSSEGELEQYLESISTRSKITRSDISLVEPNKDNAIEDLWMTLQSYAKEKSTVNYQELSKNMAMKHHKGLEKPLRIINSICVEHHYPDLTSLVIKKTTGLPANVDVSNHAIWQEILKSIYEFDWISTLDQVDFEKY